MFIKIKDRYIYNVNSIIEVSTFIDSEIWVRYGDNIVERIVFNSMEERDAEFDRIWTILNKGAE